MFVNFRFFELPGVPGSSTLAFPKENKGFVKGCGWLKIQNVMIFIRFHGISEASWEFINFHDFRSFLKIPALQRWHAKKKVIPMPFQWLQR